MARLDGEPVEGSGGPRWLGFRLEDARGRPLLSELPFGEDTTYYCCDHLWVDAGTWRRGILLRISAAGSPFEPAGSGQEQKYVYLATIDSIAQSDWTWLEWDPTRELIDGWANEGCIAYSMTMAATLRGSEIVFEPAVPPDKKEGDLLEREVDERESDCDRDTVRGPITVEWFGAMDSTISHTLVLGASDPIEILSVVLRVMRDDSGRLKTRLVRLGVDALGKRRYVTVATLKSAGFKGF